MKGFTTSLSGLSLQHTAWGQGAVGQVASRVDGQLVAGLYFVCIGKAVFGESMFSTLSDGSKMALAALVNVCQQHGIQAIDCQQNTAHLALMGAKEMARKEFLNLIQPALALEGLEWKAQQVNWDAWRSQGTA